MNVAIVLNLDGQLLKTVYEAQEILLSNFNIKHQKNNQVTPHINICSGNILDKNVDQFLDKIKKFNQTFFINKYKIYSNGLGVFVFDNPVTYLRYFNNDILLKLRNHMFKKLFLWEKIDQSVLKNLWIPKTTIAHKDTTIQSLSSIIQAICHLNFRDSIEIKQLNLIEYEINTPEKLIL